MKRLIAFATFALFASALADAQVANIALECRAETLEQACVPEVSACKPLTVQGLTFSLVLMPGKGLASTKGGDSPLVATPSHFHIQYLDVAADANDVRVDLWAVLTIDRADNSFAYDYRQLFVSKDLPHPEGTYYLHALARGRCTPPAPPAGASAATSGKPSAPAAPQSPYELGLAAFDRGDYAAAMGYWRPLATAGDARSQNKLGVLYASGLGVPKDYAEALKWTRLAAGQNLPDGQRNMGIMYEEGTGVARDLKEAVKWYRLAADQGDARAQLYLGTMYDRGLGVGRDDGEAAKWYRRAADQGNAEAEYDLAELYNNQRIGPTNSGGSVLEEAKRLYQRSADHGFANAQYKVGHDYAQSFEEAMQWYLRAAPQGQMDAAFALGDLYYYGRGVKTDYVAAEKWYRQAAAAGDEFFDSRRKAELQLGEIYDAGRGVARDHVQAAKWYLQAAALNHTTAQYRIAVMYFDGDGVKQDYVEAANWFLLSMFNGTGKSGDAANYLGFMYARGLGVPKDGGEAKLFYQRGGGVLGRLNLGAKPGADQHPPSTCVDRDESCQANYATPNPATQSGSPVSAPGSVTATATGAPAAASVIQADAECKGPKIRYEDHFSRTSLDPSWGTFGPELTVEGGRMVLRPKVGRPYWQTNDLGTYDDVDLCVTATIAKGVAPDEVRAGVIFGYLDPDNLYTLLVNAAGRTAIWRVRDGNWEEIVPWHLTEGVPKGDGTTMRLRVATRGNHATAYVNGHRLPEVTVLRGLAAQSVGVIANSAKGGVSTVTFDDFKITTPN
jgi:TPR repeat protein